MNISGIRPSVGFYDYNGIKNSVVSEVSSPELSVPAQQIHLSSDVPQSDSQQAEDASAIEKEVRARQTFGAYDYVSQYNPSATYDLKGADSDIHSLDVEKAVSDMRKDEVIHQYQYFVGQELGTQAATVPNMRGAEDFSL